MKMDNFRSRSRFRSRIYHCTQPPTLFVMSTLKPYSQPTNDLPNDRTGPDKTGQDDGTHGRTISFLAEGRQRPRSSLSEIEFRFARQLYLRTRAEIRRWSGEKRKSGKGWGDVEWGCGKRNYMQEGSRAVITINCPVPHFCRISGLRGCLGRL